MTVVTPVRDGRLPAYSYIAVGGLFAALATSRVEYAMLAAPFAAALLVGLRFSRPMAFTATFHVEREQILEGDEIEVQIELHQAAGLQLAARFIPHRAFTLVDPQPALWDFESTDTNGSIRVLIKANDWGLHPVGTRRDLGHPAWLTLAVGRRDRRRARGEGAAATVAAASDARPRSGSRQRRHPPLAPTRARQ